MHTPTTSPRSAGWLAALPTAQTLTRHKRLVGAILVLVPLAALIQGLLAESRYVSRTTVLIKLGREFQAPAAGGGRTASMFRLAEVLNSEIEILSSRSLAGEVLDVVGLAALYPKIADEVSDPALARAKAIAAFVEALTVTGITESSVMEVAYSHRDPALAQRALEVLVERFEQRHVAVFGSGVLPLAERQLAEALRELEGAEAARAAYRAENGIFDEGEQRALLLRRRDTLESTRRVVATRLERLQGAPAGVGVEGDSAAEAAIEAELLRLRAEEQKLLEGYLEDSRAVTSLREQIKLQESLLEKVRAGTAVAATEQLAALDLELSATDSALHALASHSSKLRELDRNVQRLEALHSAAVGSVSAARMDSELDAALVTSVRRIDPPSRPIEPIGLGIAPRFVFGVFAGVLLAASALLLLHLKESRQYSADVAHA